MIVSHKHKFIFVKPTKVAGTSVEVALAKHCAPEDIVTAITGYSPESDQEAYTHEPRNNSGFFNHMSPQEIRKKLGDDTWENYFKFTVGRNPWEER